MLELGTIVSTYERYLEALKDSSADAIEKFKKMDSFLNRNCEEWIRGFLIQDCYFNALRARHNKISTIEPSPIIAELIITNCSDEAVGKAKYILIRSKDTEEKSYLNSWTPTVYKYFRPSNKEELDYMKEELDDMRIKGLVSENDYYGAKELILNAVEKTENFIGDVDEKLIQFNTVEIES